MKKKLINLSPLKNFENTFKIEQFHPKSDRSVIRATTVRHPIPITFRGKEKEGITKKKERNYRYHHPPNKNGSMYTPTPPRPENIQKRKSGY